MKRLRVITPGDMESVGPLEWEGTLPTPAHAGPPMTVRVRTPADGPALLARASFRTRIALVDRYEIGIATASRMYAC